MPLSKAEKEDLLQTLREEYDVFAPYDPRSGGVDKISFFESKLEKLTHQAEAHSTKQGEEYNTILKEISETQWTISELNKPNWNTPSRTFAEKTKKDVAQIVADGLNQNISGQEVRYKKYRESHGFSYEDLGRIIGVHRKIIRQLEEPCPNSVIDPFYLEALSLIYYEDPYTLLDLKPVLINPLRADRTTHADYIMNTLTAYPSDKMGNYLQAFGKIAGLTRGQFERLCQFVESLPAFKGVKRKLEKISCEQRFVLEPSPIRFTIDQRESPEDKRALLIEKVCFEIRALDVKDHHKLRQMALWAASGESILEVLYAIMIPGGFPDRKDSVQPAASEEEYGYLSIHYVASMRRAVGIKVFHNGNVYTGSEFVQAFAVEDGRFTFVGSDDDSLFVEGEPINLDGAFVCAGFEEHIKGQIKPGQCANFVVLGADPFHTDPDKLKDIPILQTWLNGELIP